jgi:hypothetical protein
MTEQRNYTITIKAENLEKESTGIAGSNKKSDTEQRKGLLTKEGAKTFAKGMAAYHTVKSFATQVVNHEVSMVQLRTGSNELQERANFINQTVQKGIGILEGGIAGAMVGGLPGFLIGTTLSLMHSVIGYGQAVNRLNTERTLENQSIMMNFVRAGAKGSRG